MAKKIVSNPHVTAEKLSKSIAFWEQYRINLERNGYTDSLKMCERTIAELKKQKADLIRENP